MIAALIVYFLFPNVSNNHRSKLLHPIMISISVLMFIIGQLLLPYIPRFTPVVLGYVSNISPEQVIELTNQERVKAGLPELETNAELTQAALKKAGYMFAKGYWAHTAPDGTEPWKFVTDSGYKYRFAGENLARDFTTPEAVVAAWINSPSHKENLLSPRYQDIGVAVVRGDLNGVQTTLVVQFFGTKMVAAKVGGEKPVVFAPIQQEAAPNPLGAVLNKTSVMLPPFLATRNIAFLLVSLFFLILSIDMIVVRQKKIARVSSKSFAHLFFFGIILVVVVISKMGHIL